MLAFYVFQALCIRRLADRLGYSSNAWAAWVPLVNTELTCAMADLPWPWVFGIYLPNIVNFFVNPLYGAIADKFSQGQVAPAILLTAVPVLAWLVSLAVSLVLWWRLAEYTGHSGSLSLLQLAPVVGTIVVSGIVAFGTGQGAKRTPPRRGTWADHLADVWAEMKKVSWVQRKELFTTTLVVIIFSTLLAFFVSVVDFIFSRLLGIVLK